MIPASEPGEQPVPDVSVEEPETVPAPSPDKFTCDSMLGRLSRELRKLGIDAAYERGRNALQAYQRARADRRTFLTRNSRLRGMPGVFYVNSEKPAEQLAQFRAELQGVDKTTEPKLTSPTFEPLNAQRSRSDHPRTLGPGSSGSRCQSCNEPLVKLSREQARPSIPFFIYQIHSDFHRCPKCKRVYWPGSHLQNTAGQPPRSRSGQRRQRGERRNQNGSDSRRSKPED